ncbi:uncharacterized protein V1518DRAFT_411741 [Limtongia smithiae]|uniref:uncharacterized protein n=1 Tax=Limtongia smithiae TaxID=1125753 RepID=UPI0034CE3241
MHMSVKRGTPASAQHAAKRARTDAAAVGSSLAAASNGKNDDDDVDAAEFEDDIALRRAPRRKLRLQGYESDSSEEEFFSSARSRRGNDGDGKMDVDDNGDEDMFADDAETNTKSSSGRAHAEEEDDVSSDDDDVDGVSKRTRKVRFLELNEIEGQELSTTDRDARRINKEVERFAATHAAATSTPPITHDASDDSDALLSDPDEDLDPDIGPEGSRLRAPALEAFNMRADLETGAIDQNGNFLRTAGTETDVGAVAPDGAEAADEHDLWLHGVSSRDIKLAAKADERRRQIERDADLESAKAEIAVSSRELLRALVDLLEVAETPLEALARLAPQKRPNKWVSSAKARRLKAQQQQQTDQTIAAELARKQAVEIITDAADKLLNRGYADIYDSPREQLSRQIAKDF